MDVFFDGLGLLFDCMREWFPLSDEVLVVTSFTTMASFERWSFGGYELYHNGFL